MNRGRTPRGLVGAALVLGIVGGVILSQGSEPTYAFVHGASPLQISELRSGKTRGTIRIYNLHEDWRSVLTDVVKDSALSVIQEGEFKGIPAKTVVVPREEGGRAKLFETPEREITVIRGKFVLNEAGTALARSGDEDWAGVRVIEFRHPRFYDPAADWLEHTLGT